MHRSFVLAALLMTPLTGVLRAQRPLPPPLAPPPQFQRAIARETRTPTGEPGPAYWQQWTDYVLRATIDPQARRVDGTARIMYHNNSPRSLPVVFLHLLQNLHAEGVTRNEPQEVTGGIRLKRVAAAGQVLSEGWSRRGAGYRVEGTILEIRLPQALDPGASVTLEIDWGFQIPQSGAGRMGWSRDNMLYVAYWYPQMAVYDDVVGWQVDAYRGGSEFYFGFGSYDLTVEAPPGWLVMATGRLVNRSEVLPDRIRERLERAEQSDTVVHILAPEDFGPGNATRRGDGGLLRWHFVSDTVRDAAFSLTSESRWDAARTPVGDRDGDGEMDYARVDAIWRTSAPKWQHAWRYAQHSIDFLSRWTGLPYPWPHMSSVEGGGIINGGMEFPMMTLIGDYNQRGDSALYYVHAHELAHMWVPMQIGNDERRYAWMDEGTTSFNENQARKEFFPGADHDVGDRNAYLRVARQALEGEIMRWSDYHYPGPAYGTASYSKPATLLATLRALLGEDTFVRTYREYLRRWRFKHPKPWDFFNSFSAVSGQDLDWFWTTWYEHTWTLDHAVASVSSDGNYTTIVIEDRGLAPMPARVTITRENGQTEVYEVPVDTWLGGATRAEIRVAGRVVRVEIDPAGVLPDVDRRNNVWEIEKR